MVEAKEEVGGRSGGRVRKGSASPSSVISLAAGSSSILLGRSRQMQCSTVRAFIMANTHRHTHTNFASQTTSDLHAELSWPHPYHTVACTGAACTKGAHPSGATLSTCRPISPALHSPGKFAGEHVSRRQRQKHVSLIIIIIIADVHSSLCYLKTIPAAEHPRQCLLEFCCKGRLVSHLTPACCSLEIAEQHCHEAMRKAHAYIYTCWCAGQQSTQGDQGWLMACKDLKIGTVWTMS